MSDFKYALPVDSSRADQGETPVYRHRNHLDKLGSRPEEHLATMQDVLKQSVEKYPNNPMLGTLNMSTKQYEWRTYKEVSDVAERLGSQIRKNRLYHDTRDELPQSGSYTLPINLFGVYSKNREEWLFLEYAAYYQNFSIVPLYDTLGATSFEYIMSQTQLNTIFLSGESAARLLKIQSFYQLKNVISFDPLPEETIEGLKARGINVGYLKDLLDTTNEEVNLPHEKVDHQSIFTFCYTSGTTGNPKGVLQTHANAVAFLAAVKESVGALSVTENDVHYSYLPLPHVYERQVCLSFIYSGASIGFYSGDLVRINSDLASLKPTIFASVPRLFNRYYQKIKESLGQLSEDKKVLVEQAISEKIEAMRLQPDLVKSEKWDDLIFKEIRAILGGRIRGFITGGAALSGEVAEFLKIAFSCCFNEGYGQTEAFGGAFNNVPFDGKYGNVGGVQPSLEFKLVDIPEMGYLSTDKNDKGESSARGEVYIRGHQVCAGYYKDLEKTQLAIDNEGWLHTGDVAQLMYDNSLRLIDRKGNLFKLSQGEYVAPETIENVYSRAKGVAEAFVYGEALRSYLVALFVIDLEYVLPYAKANGIEGTKEELCADKRIVDHLLKNALEEGKKAQLNGYEQVKGVILTDKPLFFHGVTTNTFKIKRNDAKNKFKDVFTVLYSDIDTLNPWATR